ncbi:PREDICTED: GDSL esterase/lipase At2g03980-like [Lupinus angustifolius]|uniref:GDSL esterase/lipase At2g03980-like n=1 Tax=Lupinus angustifolius TaxID=3871 RepID=UPI00092E1FFA|nr:PREDICTED: GDSL esterase/lipase At2g03980-like [Lupinus angustifolius]
MTSFKAFWVISCIAYQAFYAKVNGAKSHVPALYVFGDSGLDAGNNNNLKTLAKANVAPYGIDFNNTSTGRYTNGKTFADLIAIKLGLPFSPPYLGVSESRRYLVTAGVNYASGACGILNDTKYGECLSLDKQIEYFTSTVTKDLPKHFESKDKLKHHLSKSIYLIVIGSNDYSLNYFQHENMEPEEFADYLLGQLACKIKTIFDLGARKFVVGTANQLGCSPSQFCNETINRKVKPSSDKLPIVIQKLQKQLSGSLFVYVDSFNFFNRIRNAPKRYAYQAFYAKVNGAKSHVPALYVFGDSGLDAGNNNNLKTLAKANVAPYGIDFNNTSTGRYTNGKTFADLIAIKLGLPFSPPYLGVSESRRYLVTAGVNYASGRMFVIGQTN